MLSTAARAELGLRAAGTGQGGIGHGRRCPLRGEVGRRRPAQTQLEVGPPGRRRGSRWGLGRWATCVIETGAAQALCSTMVCTTAAHSWGSRRGGHDAATGARRSSRMPVRGGVVTLA
ncbi:hypothetical protein SEVIR_6G169251v4 [Setaria viridis]